MVGSQRSTNSRRLWTETRWRFNRCSHCLKNTRGSLTMRGAKLKPRLHTRSSCESIVKSRETCLKKTDELTSSASGSVVKLRSLRLSVRKRQRTNMIFARLPITWIGREHISSAQVQILRDQSEGF